MRVALGIPYATAPRFGAPSPVAYDRGRGDSAQFGPAAPQPVDGPLGEIVPGMNVRETDEHGCLTLNVWAPEPLDGEGPRPVLVWFHGGSFVIGASFQPVYDGALLASEQRVVVVSANYRLGAFGFLDMRASGGVTNCGLRDAICALAWVRDNIAAFGGDPARVVAFGESAGGGLVLHALASPAGRGLMAGAIVQSGATFATLDEQKAALVRDAVVNEAGARDPGALHDLTEDDLVKAQASAMGPLLGTIGMMPFHPMVDGDVLLAAPVEALAGGTGGQVALIAGTTGDEMRLFVDGSGDAPVRERLVRRTARYLSVDDDIAAAIVDRYAVTLRTDDTREIWRAIFGDNEMQVPCGAVLDAHAAHGPTYTYAFTWEGPEAGSCHGIDIPFTFGNFVEGWDAFAGLDDDARALSSSMRAAWGAFARNGDPGWPAYPAARVFGRTPRDAPAHPLLGRLAAARG